MKKLSGLRSSLIIFTILALIPLKGFTQPQKSGYKIIAYMMGARVTEYAESLKLKAEYVNKMKLAGVMFWEYSGDSKGELLGALYQNLFLKE